VTVVVRMLDVSTVERLLKAASKHCHSRRFRAMAFAAVDGQGDVMCVRRMDDAMPLTPEIAVRKAYTAAIMRQTTDAFAAKCQSRKGYYESIRDAGARPLWAGGAGGIPICSGNQLIGAVGASGGDPAEDLECLEVGLQAAGLRRGNLGSSLCFLL